MSCVEYKKSVLAMNGETPSFIDNQLWAYTRLADFLDVPIATIKDWVYKRQIPFVKVGRHIRFVPSDVQKWLSERTHNDDTAA
mgnify:CR=1 FL=1